MNKHTLRSSGVAVRRVEDSEVGELRNLSRSFSLFSKYLASSSCWRRSFFRMSALCAMNSSEWLYVLMSSSSSSSSSCSSNFLGGLLRLFFPFRPLRPCRLLLLLLLLQGCFCSLLLLLRNVFWASQ